MHEKRHYKLLPPLLGILVLLLQACSQPVGDVAEQPSQAISEELLQAIDKVTDEQLAGITLNVIDGLYGSLQLEPAGLADTPYTVNFITAGNASDQMALLLSGRADLNVYGDISFAGIVAADVPLLIVHGMQRPRRGCGIAVHADSPYRRIADLQGRTIANSSGFSSEIVAIRAFRQAGLDFFRDTQVVDMKVLADGRAAFLNRRVDAWAGCTEIFVNEVLDGQARLLVTGEDDLWIGHNYWGIQRSSLRDPVKLAALLDYIRRVDKSFDWANAHPDEHGRLLASLFHTDPQKSARYLTWSGPTHGRAVDQSMIDGLQATYDDEAKLGRLPLGRSVAPFFTDRFIPYFDQ